MKGEGWYPIKHKRFAVKPNQYFVLPRGVAHEYGSELKEPWSIYWISYTGENAECFTNYLLPKQNNSPVLVAPSALRRMIFEDILYLGFWNNISNLIYASSSLYTFLASFQKLHLRLKNNEENPIEEVIALMKSNLDKSFSYEELAHHIHVSPSRLSALFREKTKYSPIYLFTSFKIQRACQLLRDSGKSVKAIANQLGYEDQYHFSRVFKNIMGISPKFFRESPH